MIKLQDYIIEKLHIGNYKKDKYHPKTTEELRNIISERINNFKDDDYGHNKVLDLNDIDVSDITSFENLFQGLEPIYNIDISEWDVSNVKTMRGMFYDYKYLQSTGKLDKWDVSKCECTGWMFYNCINLKNIGDISNWNVDRIEEARYMFCDCKRLNTVGDLKKWKEFGKKNSIYSTFYNCIIKPLPPKYA